MKRRLALLVCIIATLAMVFTLASCGGDECEHTYSTEYTTDANGHWYVATCGCEGEVSNYGAHVDSNNDGKCDTCKYVICAHTYETEWSTDENNHWNASNCDCTPTKANEAKHVDENKDGICDVCKYVMCEHTYSDWKTDETKHWKEATCGCTVANTEEGAHVDENKDGNCDTCAYVMCEHTYATEWSTDGAYHWYEATCGCNVVGSKAEHTNEDGDKLCDVCEANICEHTYEETLSSNETHHWYAATCGCDVKKDYAEHTWATIVEEKLHYKGTTCGCEYTKDVAEHADEDEDGKCDTCESDMTLLNVIAGLDQEANAGANNIVVDVDKAVYSDYGDEVIDAETFVKYYKDYAVYKDVDGNTYYYSYYGENGTDLFAIIVNTEGNASRNEYGEYPVGGATMTISLVYGNAGTYNGNIEEIVYELYNLGAAKDQEYGYSYCFTKSYNEETDAHKFAYVYFEEDKAYEVKVEFTVAENAIATSTIEINTYYGEDVTVSGNTYTVAEGAAKTQEEKYVIAQTFGDPFDSTDAPNPYPAADYIVTEDYKLGVKDEDGDITEIEKNATVEIDAAKDVYFYFPESLKDVIGFNDVNTTVYDSEDNESYSVSCYYDSDEKAICVRSNYAGTYKVVVDLEGVEFTFNVKVNYLAPQTMSTFTINVDSGKGTSESEVTMYNGQSLRINSVVSAGCDPAFVAALTKGDAATLEINEFGTYTFKPSATGEFEVTLTSSVASDVTAKITITVVTPPTAAEVLVGTHKGDFMKYLMQGQKTGTITVVFTPAEEGATNGTLTVNVKGVEQTGPFWEPVETPFETNTTFTYTFTYEDSKITLTKTEGDDVTIELLVTTNYEIAAIYDNSELITLKAVAPVVPEEPSNATTSPFNMTVSDTYGYYDADAFTFVAGEAGTYTFTVPAGVGILVDWSNEVISYFDNQAGTTFELDLDANEEVLLVAQSTTTGTYEITFTVGTAGGDDETTLSGSGTVADPYIITVGGNYVCDYAGGGYTAFTYYVYTATADGDVVFTFTDSNKVYGVSYGTNVDALEYFATSWGQGSSVTVSVTTGDTVYFAVQEYNGTACEIPFSITLPGASADAGEDEETEGIAGTYSVYNEMFPETTMTVVITDETITFTPPGPGAMEVSYTYTYENNIVTLYDAEGNAITSPLAGYLTVVDGEPTELGYNGSTYLFGEPEAEETNELVLGENEVDVVVEGGFPMATTVTFTATEAGTYTISPADGETNADVTVVDGDWIEEFPYTFTLEAGQSISFDVCSADAMSTTTDTINLVIAKAE